MKAVIKREIKNYLKNPMLWIGLIVVILGIYQNVNPFLRLHYFKTEKELEKETVTNKADADVMDGYIPSTKKQQMELGIQEIKRLFIKEFKYSEVKAEEIVGEIRKKNMTFPEISKYLEKNYKFFSAKYIFEDFEIHKGTMEEVNSYIKEKVDKKPFSYYFARKFADFCGLYMGFFATVLLAFLYIRDTKRDTYELLHTKPISAVKYICGKVMGGFLTMLLVLGILNLFFGLLCEAHGKSAGLPVRFFDIFEASLFYIVPNLLMITCVYTIVALIFKNPLPAMPLLFLYIVYSNMGSVGIDGNWGYYGRPLAIMVRLQGSFLEITPPPFVLLNQTFLVAASVLITFLTVTLWKRRRVY